MMNDSQKKPYNIWKKGKNMSEERCVLCNKPYEYEHYHLFGRGCLDNLYELLDIKKPYRKTKNLEKYLCNRIAW